MNTTHSDIIGEGDTQDIIGLKLIIGMFWMKRSVPSLGASYTQVSVRKRLKGETLSAGQIKSQIFIPRKFKIMKKNKINFS